MQFLAALVLSIGLLHGNSIAGQVTYGPLGPVCRPSVPCSRPYATAVTVAGRHGTRTIQTDADGRYAVRVSPGRYTVTPVCAHPHSVTVTVGHGTLSVNLVCDSTIR